jgi:hypothetical protein
MSWASNRRTLYASGVMLAVVAVAIIPVTKLLYHAPTCFDGIQNQGETLPDVGGPCSVLDVSSLRPQSVKWVRAFLVRPGEYAATAYIENPNKNAGVMSAPYHFSFYDANNILIAEKSGTTMIMPGAITPVYVSQIASGDRVIAHAFFEFTAPLVWIASHNAADALTVTNIRTDGINQTPHVSADITNTAVTDQSRITYVATLFDGAGNAFASSQTILQSLAGGATSNIVFTWPSAFTTTPTRIDILPVMKPVAD